MAGSGIRVFAAGEILTAAQVNGYLMDQTVTRFADAFTRDGAFGGAGQPVLTEGRLCYLDDVNLIQFYDGASWVSSSQFTVGDGTITEVKLADNSVTSAKIAPGTVIAADIAAGTITATELADGAVTSGKIFDGTIVNADVNASASIAYSKLNLGTSIVNADISASASIVDTKLATISSIGKVANSATTATDANTNSAIVARDPSGNFSAGTVSATGASVSGRFDGTSIREVVIDASVSASVVTADYSTGDIFYVGTAPSSNFTVNLTNAPTDNGKAITVVVFVTQGATGYIPNAVQVAGSAQTIKWANGAAPTPTSSAGKIDIFSFTFVRRSSAWTVFGSSNLGY
jgi:hypothetical protein